MMSLNNLRMLEVWEHVQEAQKRPTQFYLDGNEAVKQNVFPREVISSKKNEIQRS